MSDHNNLALGYIAQMVNYAIDPMMSSVRYIIKIDYRHETQEAIVEYVDYGGNYHRIGVTPNGFRDADDV